MDSEAPKGEKKRVGTLASETPDARQPPRDAAPVDLTEKIQIFPGQRIDHLSHAGASAYAARSLGDGKSLFAMICGKAAVPRINSIASYKGVNTPGLLQLVESRVVFWPPENQQKLALVFEMPPGPPFMADLDATRDPVPDDTLIRIVLNPMAEILKLMRNSDMVHGAIRTTNIFQGGSAGNEIAILGECLSAPSSYTQPAIFEPIERAMAQPGGRGLGTSEDDLYALGVTMAMLLRGRNLLAGLSDTEVIEAKIEQGSYVALLGSERVSARLTEFLRGVLSDDPAQRWDIDDVLKWMEGRHLNPKQPKIEKKAARPFEFGGEKIWHARALTIKLTQNVSSAAQIIDSGELSQWVRRSLENPAVHKRLEWAIDSAKEGGAGAGYQQRLVTRTCIALDPAAPLRYKDISVLPRGFGAALAECAARGGDVKTFADAINLQLVNFWLSVQSEISGDSVALVSQFDNCRGFLRQSMSGYGLERVLYFLCDEAPCLSPTLQNFYVATLPDLAIAFEKISQSEAARPETLIDRHIAAFLSTRDKKIMNQKASLVGSDDKSARNLGALLIFAEIQKRYRLGPLPGLSRWIGDILKPVVDRYHNRPLREKIQKDIEKVKNTGDLVLLASVVDNTQNVRADSDGFAVAVHEYAMLSQEHAQLSQKMQIQGRKMGLKAGQEIAAALSGVISTIIILGLIVINFTSRL